MATAARTGRRPVTAPWRVVAEQELRDLWLAGRGLPLMLAFTALLSVSTYLVATNRELNFLEQRESVSLTLQVAVAVGALLVLLAASDAISGERERGTLETLLVTPAPRRSIMVGKGLAALSLWAATFVMAIPYLWFVARGVGLVGVAIAGGFAVGVLLALFLAGLGLLVSAFAASNRLSLSVGLFILLALYAPTQMPTAAQRGWAGDLLSKLDPITAGLHYIGKLVIDGHSAGRDAEWLVSPVAAAVLAPAAALAVAGRLSLRRGDRA